LGQQILSGPPSMAFKQPNNLFKSPSSFTFL